MKAREDKDTGTKTLDRCRINKLVACSVDKKYYKMCSDMFATATVYASKLLSKIKDKGKSITDKHFATQHLIKSCIQYHTLNFCACCIVQGAETTSESQIHNILCGQGFIRTSRTEY